MILSHSIHPALTLQKRRKLKTHFVSLGIIVLLLQSCVSTVRSVLQCKQCKEFIEQCYLHLQCYFFPPSPLSWYWLKEDIEKKFQNQSQWKFWSSDSVQVTTEAVLFPPCHKSILWSHRILSRGNSWISFRLEVWQIANMSSLSTFVFKLGTYKNTCFTFHIWL